MAKISILLNLGLTIFRVGAGVGSRLSGFISGHNFWTLVSGGRYIRSYSRISSCLYLLLLMDICYHTMEFIYLSRVLRPLKIKGQPTHDRSHVALMSIAPVTQRSWVRVPFKLPSRLSDDHMFPCPQIPSLYTPRVFQIPTLSRELLQR